MLPKLNMDWLHIRAIISLHRFPLILFFNEEVNIVVSKEKSSTKFWDFRKPFVRLWFLFAEPYAVNQYTSTVLLGSRVAAIGACWPPPWHIAQSNSSLIVFPQVSVQFLLQRRICITAEWNFYSLVLIYKHGAENVFWWAPWGPSAYSVYQNYIIYIYMYISHIHLLYI